MSRKIKRPTQLPIISYGNEKNRETAIKPLPKKLIGKGEVKGFEFIQLKATNLAYLYKVEDFGMIHYEVFEKRINARFGNISYPNSNGFGIWAWTFRDFDKAMRKFNELNNFD